MTRDVSDNIGTTDGSASRFHRYRHLERDAMALWNKLRTELDRAGRVAQGAIDEGKLRLEIFRARQLVDRAAQSLGYAVYRSRAGLATPDDLAVARLVEAVRERELELAALEERMRAATGRVPPRGDAPPEGGAEADAPPAASGSAADDAASVREPAAPGP
jgi:hypothetical protein